MQSDMSSGLGQADLSITFDHRQSTGFRGGMKLKDIQVFIGEYIGTFYLGLLVSASKITDSVGATPYAIGFGLIAIVYALGPISGAQVNPAASIALVIRGKLKVFEACYCAVAQILGAVTAGLVSYYLYNYEWKDIGYPQVTDSSRRPQAFVAEFIQTFALMSVALNTATTNAQANNSYYGMAIGFIVASGALVIGGVSGACFNPAIAMLTLMSGDTEDLWVFFVAPMLGGVAAGLLFRINNPSEWDDSDPVAKLTRNHHNPDGNVTRMIAMLFQEFQGTFYLAWTVALSVNVVLSSGAIAIALILSSYIYAGGSVSGAHYNPCVTIGVYLRGLKEPNHMRLLDVCLYILVQISAAFAGGGVAAYVNGGLNAIASPAINYTDHTRGQAFLIEFLFSLLLVFTVLTTATTENVSGNSYFGVAIGFVILAGSVIVADISGGVFNPAIGIALPALTHDQTADIWVYVFANILGGIAASIFYRFFYWKSSFVNARSVSTHFDKNLDRGMQRTLLLNDDSELGSRI